MQQAGTAESEIQALIEAWADAVRRHDLPGILAHHDRDIMMFDVPLPLQSLGMTEYKKTWDLFFKYHEPSEAFDIEQLAITAGEDVAFAAAILRCGSATVSGPPEQGGFLFRLTIGLRKIDGDWRITHEHHSVPTIDVAAKLKEHFEAAALRRSGISKRRNFAASHSAMRTAQPPAPSSPMRTTQLPASSSAMRTARPSIYSTGSPRRWMRYRSSCCVRPRNFGPRTPEIIRRSWNRSFRMLALNISPKMPPSFLRSSTAMFGCMPPTRNFSSRERHRLSMGAQNSRPYGAGASGRRRCVSGVAQVTLAADTTKGSWSHESWPLG